MCILFPAERKIRCSFLWIILPFHTNPSCSCSTGMAGRRGDVERTISFMIPFVSTNVCLHHTLSTLLSFCLSYTQSFYYLFQKDTNSVLLDTIYSKTHSVNSTRLLYNLTIKGNKIKKSFSFCCVFNGKN